jgi:hypothetical protein
MLDIFSLIYGITQIENQIICYYILSFENDKRCIMEKGKQGAWWGCLNQYSIKKIDCTF